MKNTLIYASIWMLFFCTKSITSTAQTEAEMKSLAGVYDAGRYAQGACPN